MYSRFVVGSALVLGSSFVVTACSDGHDDVAAPHDAESETQLTSAPPANTPEAHRDVPPRHSRIARVELSATHHVDFMQDDRGEFVVSEDYHMDLDRDQPTLLELVQASPDEAGLRLAPVYRHLLGEHVDLALLGQLEEADLAIEERELESAQWRATEGSALEAPLADVNESFSEEALAPELSPATLEKGSSSCSIAEFPSGWSWPDDGAALKSQLCGTSRDHCKFNMATTSTDFKRTTNKYVAIGVAQDFCNVQRLIIDRLSEQVCIPFARSIFNGLEDIKIQPRIIHTHTRTVTESGWCFDRIFFRSTVKKSSGPHGSRGGLVVNPVAPRGPAECDGVCEITIVD